MDTQRLILFIIFGFSLVMLWEAWQRDHRPVLPPSATSVVPATPGAVPGGLPGAAVPAGGAGPAAVPPAAPAVKGEIVRVQTDRVIAEINSVGATLSRLELLRHKDSEDPNKDFVLIGPAHEYEAQSGLTGPEGPNHRTLWHAEPGERTLKPGQESLLVRFSAQNGEGLKVEKTYTFHRDSYVVDVTLTVQNKSAAAVSSYAYFQLTHDGKPDGEHTGIAASFGARSFTGFALYSEQHKFQKVAPADVDKAKAEYVHQADNGWLAFVQHYFVSAWLPASGAPREYAIEKRPDGTYAGRAVLPLRVAAGATGSITVSLYAGPQEKSRLETAAPGFDLVVDYGWLTIIAWPLFWLLQKLHALTGNWGVAIILLTVLIKLIFFPLSAASYKSMAKMKLITPRLTKLREMYANDRQKMNQAMMELYRTEKINPLGGCFPIVVQIPVFIALYWVLLASIELRHAPFILWIKDLSALDPYFVLPILMTGTMVLQTRMNPKPPDPVQAKVMQFMPFIFSIFFFFFPAGLVLYWLVNNILSILQQWQIQRLFNRDKPAHARR
jgi:YidC/Oxa1 family membrane protein insertase